MARYTYNSGLVSQTIEELNVACKTLDSTNIDIQKGINIIRNARGAENIDVDYDLILRYKSSVIDYIDEKIQSLKSKVREIEEYQDTSWWKKIFATAGMGILKIVEGIATTFEQIGDGIISIIGFFGGIFSSDFRDCIGEFVKKDMVGDTFAKWYNEGWLQSVNKNSYMSHESTAANVLKGIGIASGYVLTASSPSGLIAISALGGVGAGTQSGLQAGQTFNQAFGNGIKQGTIAACSAPILPGVANSIAGVKMADTNFKSVKQSDVVVADTLSNNSTEIKRLESETTANVVSSEEQFVTSTNNESTPDNQKVEISTMTPEVIPNQDPLKPQTSIQNLGYNDNVNDTITEDSTIDDNVIIQPPQQNDEEQVDINDIGLNRDDSITLPPDGTVIDTNGIYNKTNDATSRKVENTLGNKTASSLTAITGKRTIIPSSSAPITDKNNDNLPKAITPLGSSLGIAAVAGLGAKTVIDKKAKKKEESETIMTEEWSDFDNIEMDYGLKTEETRDYLDPTDEFAFQE